MLNREDTNIKKNTLIYVSNENNPSENLGEKGITIAFGMSTFWGDGLFDDKKYGEFKLFQKSIKYVKNETDGTINRVFIDTPIPYSKCSINSTAFRYLS